MSVPLFSNPRDEIRIKISVLKRVSKGLPVATNDTAEMPIELQCYDTSEIAIAISLLISERLLIEVGESDTAVRAIVSRGGIGFTNVIISKGGISWLRDMKWKWINDIKSKFIEHLVCDLASKASVFIFGAITGYILRVIIA